GQSLFVRSNDGGEQFAGELAPEMIEKILHRAADAAVVIGRAEHVNVRALHAGLQRVEPGRVVGRVRVIERQRLCFKIERIHDAALGLQAFGDMQNNGACDRPSMQTSRDGQDLQRLIRHAARLTGFLEDATASSDPNDLTRPGCKQRNSLSSIGWSIRLAVLGGEAKVLPASCRQIVPSRIVSLCRRDAGSTLNRYQEGNWPAGVAPLLGGAGGGFRGTMRAQNSGKSLLSPLLRLPAAPLRSAAQAGRGERKQKRAP